MIVATGLACGDGGPADDPSTTSLSSSAATAVTTSTSGDTASTTGGDTTADASDESNTPDASSTDDPPVGPPSIARVGETFVIPTLAASMPKRFADVAHDPIADVYLQVNGNVATSATVLDGDGVPISDPLVIADAGYTQGVRVVFGGDAFLVAWHDNRDAPDSARLRARRVQWDGAAAQLGADVEVGTGDTYSEMPPAISWSQTQQAFLVAWHSAVGDDIVAQRVDAQGSKVGPTIAVTTDPDWQSDAGIAWNPGRDEWLVVYTHAGATTEVRGRRIADDGSLLGNEITIATAAGTWLAQAAYDPGKGEYLVAWFEGRIAARRLDADGVATTEIFELATGYGSYDGFAMAYNDNTATYAAVFHGTTDEDFAVAFDADGVQSAVIEATMSRGADGHFNPRIAASGTRQQWLLVTSRGFADVVGQRLAH